MSYKRRKFLKYSLTTGSFLLSSSSLFAEFIFNKSKITDKTCNLNKNSCHHVKQGQQIHLPMKPEDGDSIFLVIESNEIKKPAVIKFQGQPILGDNEDLILDSIANIKLSFKTSSGWSLT